MAAGQKTDYTTLENLKDALTLLGVVFPTPAGGGVPDDGSVTNAKVAANAAISYSKLNLTGAILSADLAGSIARSKIAIGTGFAWVVNAAGGALSEVAPTNGRVIYADGNGLPTGSSVTQAALESGLTGRNEIAVSAQTTVTIPLLTGAEQQEINLRFTPSADDVMFEMLTSTDGSTFASTAYVYVGHIFNGTGTVTGFDTPVSDRFRLEHDNGTANAGVGNLSTEGIWGRVSVRDRGQVSPARWATIDWDLSYRNALSQQRTVKGAGFHQVGERITHVRFQFEGGGAFSGAYSIGPVLSL